MTTISHPREGGGPAKARERSGWIPAFAGMTIFATTLAWADDLTDYRSQARIATISTESLHRAALPFEAYRDATQDFADLRVFNAAGEALPIAFAGEPEAVKSEAPSTLLPIFPVSAAPPRRTARFRSRSTSYVKSDAQRDDRVGAGATGREAHARSPSRGSLDASQLTSPIRALIFDWDVGAGTEIVDVNVDASDDLKAWRRVVSHAQLVHLRAGGTRSSSSGAWTWAGSRAKYLRITGEHGRASR